MITYHVGDLLESGCNIICHQVNLQGVMGGGIALQIARKYPECEKEYREFIKLNSGDLVGNVNIYKIDQYHFIANCFTQDEYFNTDYYALRRIKLLNSLTTIGFPHGYGCGIAHGEWGKVEAIIKEVFEDSDIDCQICAEEIIKKTDSLISQKNIK